ncbi:ATP-binding protein [Photobacterium atrarenae]|uniref:ATP-binding protein n=1 Tax=Photobacterium atrarenae TaxID=865757 RepID=A0ABY5GC78_9GAMM|nr:ATP-binding protein [Photobacterium atrarenae]UTV26410.1 ATP-binding protein [Photobacterium atrarenae]
MNVMERLQRTMPSHVKPMSREDIDAYGRRQVAEFHRKNREDYRNSVAQNLLGRSGVRKIHQQCSFENYQVHGAAQEKAVANARAWLSRFYADDMCCFVFAGSTGTGKNHLASAIANDLNHNGRSSVLMTVNELMIRLRDTYRADSPVSERELIERLSSVDLLILDEVGVQRGNDNEALTLNTIVDNRSADGLPTGILTNLNYSELVKQLGERVMDRLKSNQAHWVEFNWPSYRSQGSAA